MRFESIKIHGMGEYKTDIDIDLSSIDGKLVAVTGRNGSGKSTLLGFFPASLYRQCPYQKKFKSLSSFAVTRDSFVEARIVNGHTYTVRQTIDAHTGKGESLVMDEAGNPLVSSAKVRDFDNWAKQHIVPPDVLYTSSFAVQGSGGFLDLLPAERKRVLLRILGIERLEKMSETSRSNAKEAKNKVEMIRDRIADSKASAPDLEEAKAALTKAEKEVEQKSEEVKASRSALEKAMRASEDAQRANEIAEQRQAVQRRLNSLWDQTKELKTRIENNKTLLTRLVEINIAVEDHKRFSIELEELNKIRFVTETSRNTALNNKHHHLTIISTARNGSMAAGERAVRASQRLLQTASIKKAMESIPSLKVNLEFEEKELQKAQEREAELHYKQLNHKDIRINGLREALTDIVSENDDQVPVEIARAGIQSDDALLEGAKTLPAQIATAKEMVSTEQQRVIDAAKALQEAEKLADKYDDLQAAKKDLYDAEKEQQGFSEEIEKGTGLADTADEEAKKADEDLKSIWASIEQTEKKQKELQQLVDLAPRLEQAKTRIEELEPQLKHTVETRNQAENELKSLPDVEVESIDINKYKQEANAAELAEHEAIEAVSRAKGSIENAEKAAERIQTMSVDLEHAESELADWTRLSQDLGKDGLQALEIDAAIPELNEIANDLLHTCHGPRFTVEVRSTRLDSKGKKELEDLEIRVIDGEKGRDATSDEFSGGECVIVGEALALALTMIGCRRNNIERPTLIRDETGAALDPQNGPAYISMLRRAVELINADKCLFVSHSVELQELADNKIVIENGTITVQ